MSNQSHSNHHQQQGSGDSSATRISNGLQASMAELEELENLFGLINEHLNTALQLAAKEIDGSHQEAAVGVTQGLTQMLEEAETFAGQIEKIRSSADQYVGQVV